MKIFLCNAGIAIICRGCRSFCPGCGGSSHILCPFFLDSLDVVTCALQLAVSFKFDLVPFGILDGFLNALFAQVGIFQNGSVCGFLCGFGFLCGNLCLVIVKRLLEGFVFLAVLDIASLFGRLFCKFCLYLFFGISISCRCVFRNNAVKKFLRQFNIAFLCEFADKFSCECDKSFLPSFAIFPLITASRYRPTS